MDFSRLKAALLDFDGTLVDLPVDWEALRGQIAALFAAHGHNSDFRPLYQSIADAFAALEESGASPGLRAGLRRRLNALMTEAEIESSDAATAMPGARELLTDLRGRGWKLVIQSSNSVRCIEKVLERLSFPPIDAIVGRESSRDVKPNPSGVRRALREVGVRAKDTVVIGDGDFDVQVGCAIGAATIRIGRGNADYQVESLEGVRQLLGGGALPKVAV